jgi:hypothetical protein
VPIDFSAIAARFGDLLAEETHPLPFLFDRFDDAVKKLVEQSEKAERATRAYPIFRYRDGALAVHVDPLGAELLPIGGAPLGFVAGLEAGGRRFLDGLGWTRTAVEQELALPRILLVAREAVDVVLASIERFRRPGAAMLDDRARRLSDVFGLLVLGWNSLLGGEAREQLLGAARGAAGLRTELDRLVPPSPSTGRSTIDALVDTFEGLGEQMLAAVVLLPVVGEALAVLVHDGALAAKRTILGELTSVEAEVGTLRSAAVDGLLRGIGLGQLAADWLSAARDVVLGDIWVLSTTLPSLVRSFLDGLRAFAQGVNAWGWWLSNLMTPLRVMLTLFMRLDLIGLVLRKFLSFLPDWIFNRLSHPVITIDDIVTFLLGQGAWWVKPAIDQFFDGALRIINAVDHLPGVDVGKFYWRVDALAEVFKVVLTRTPPPPPDVVPPLPPLAGFPNVYDAFFGGGKEAALVADVDALGVEVRGGIRSALGAASTMFDRLGTTFAAEADRAASTGSTARMRGLAADSAVFAERVFGPEADRLRADAGSSRPDPLAAAFEGAVTSGGFALVGGAIPAYVGEMRRFWATKRPPVPPPTSPHILARHGRLGGVRVPRLTVRASGRIADRRLAALVAARFHDAVGEAYVGGRREFERLGGPPLRRPARPPGRRPVPSRPGAASGP